MAASTRPVKDRQTVTPEGESLQQLIQGVVLRRPVVQEDERGQVVEIFNPAWKVHPDPLVYVYQVAVRPGRIKGWVQHRGYDDRIFHVCGTLRWVLYDDRARSSTRGMLNKFVLSERSGGLLIIPRGVYHAVQNIGQGEGIFVNMPTRPYDHADPDKYRLPLQNDLIPFDFEDRLDW